MQSISLGDIDINTHITDYINEKKKIILVDDNEDILTIYKIFLTNKSSQYDYLTFSSPEKAIHYIRRHYSLLNSKISLIISDLNMGQVNGIEFFKNFKKLGIQAPFIILSSYLTDSVQKEAIGEGIDECYLKEFDMEKTFSLFTSLFNKYRLLDQE
ncbi:MAG: response regulator [Candidatus Thorarchaeota archaeon]